MTACPICNNGNLTEVTGKFGKYFVCSNHPLCQAKCKSVSGEPDIDSLISRCPDTILTFNNSEIKLALLKIAKLAYPEHEIPEFIIVLKPKESKRVHGLWYYPQPNRISRIYIFNLSRKYEHTLTTCIHELAHHCHYMIEGKTNHKREFYVFLQHLLTTAHNHGFINLVETYDEVDSADRKRLEKYFGAPHILNNNKTDFYIFRVDIPDIKSTLKSHGYTYSYKELKWVKPVHGNKVFEEIDIIEENYPDVAYEIINNREHSVESIYFCIISKFQPLHPDMLKENGFILNEVNGWIKKIQAKDYRRTVAFCASVKAKPTFKGYLPTRNLRERAYKDLFKATQPMSDHICPKCGGTLVISNGKFGQFYSCNKFIFGCRYTQQIGD